MVPAGVTGQQKECSKSSFNVGFTFLKIAVQGETTQYGVFFFHKN
jgi:hypothetical protein